VKLIAVGLLESGRPDAAKRSPQDLTTAKTVAKVSDTAGGTKSAARRSTGLDYYSGRLLKRQDVECSSEWLWRPPPTPFVGGF
jgi:hypothetical protein